LSDLGLSTSSSNVSTLASLLQMCLPRSLNDLPPDRREALPQPCPDGVDALLAEHHVAALAELDLPVVEDLVDLVHVRPGAALLVEGALQGDDLLGLLGDGRLQRLDVLVDQAAARAGHAHRLSHEHPLVRLFEERRSSLFFSAMKGRSSWTYDMSKS
jgi:hypothetical protein